MSEKEEQFERLSAYLDGEMSSADTWDIEKAIETDPALAAELKALRAMRQVLRKLPAEPVPRDFASRVLERAERRHLVGYTPAGAALRSSRWITFAAAAVVLVAACFGAFIMVYTGSPPAGDDVAIVPPAPEGPAAKPARPPGGDVVAVVPSAAEEPAAKPVGPPGGDDVAVVPPAAEEPAAKPVGPAEAAVGIDERAARSLKGGKPGAAVFAKKSGPFVREAREDRDERPRVAFRGKLGGGETPRGDVRPHDDAVTATENVVIATADLALARRDVEAVLARNGLRPAVLEIADSTDNTAAKAGLGRDALYQTGSSRAPLLSVRSRAGVYHLQETSPTRIRFDVPIDPAQIAKVKNELAALPRWNRPARAKEADRPDAEQVDFLAYDDRAVPGGEREFMTNVAEIERDKLYAKVMAKPAPSAKRDVSRKAKAAPPAPGRAERRLDAKDADAAPAKVRPRPEPRRDARQAAPPAGPVPVQAALAKIAAAAPAAGIYAAVGGSIALAAQTAPATRPASLRPDRDSRGTFAGQAGTLRGHAQVVAPDAAQAQQARRVGAKLQRLVITLNLTDSARSALRLRAAETQPATRQTAPAGHRNNKAKSE